eukprot:305009-Prorocentrum_minimum.AAC.1
MGELLARDGRDGRDCCVSEEGDSSSRLRWSAGWAWGWVLRAEPEASATCVSGGLDAARATFGRGELCWASAASSGASRGAAGWLPAVGASCIAASFRDRGDANCGDLKCDTDSGVSCTLSPRHDRKLEGGLSSWESPLSLGALSNCVKGCVSLRTEQMYHEGVCSIAYGLRTDVQGEHISTSDVLNRVSFSPEAT